MKTLPFVLLLCLAGYFTSAQDITFRSNREKQLYKPQLFVKEAARLSVRQNFINEMLTLRLNQQVTIQVTPKTNFKGRVSAIKNEVPGLQTYILQSSEIPGLVLSISKLEKNGEAPVYRGIMISKDHSDMLMLEKDIQTGEYVWNKKQVAHVIPD
jgi:hypothetical protein